MPIHFQDLHKRFGDKHVLRGVDLKVEDGECFFVIGTSGVGKSVLIKHLVGLLRPDAGDILLDGQEVSRLSERDLYPVRMKCAMVFQHSTLFELDDLCRKRRPTPAHAQGLLDGRSPGRCRQASRAGSHA